MTRLHLEPLRRLRRLVAERDGVAVVEFAFVAPLMLFLMVVVVDLGNMITVQRKLTGAAQSTADLIAQERQLSQAELDNAFSALDMMLSPFDPAERNVTIYSVVMDEDTSVISVDWEEQRGSSPIPPSILDLPDGLLSPGSSIIVVKTNYNHRTFLGGMMLPILGVVGSETFEMEDEAYLHPRRVPFIPLIS